MTDTPVAIIASGPMHGFAGALAALGVAVPTPISWATLAAGGGAATLATARLVLADATGVDEAVLAPGLMQIAGAGAPVIAAVSAGQIDLAAGIIGTGALMCGAAEAEMAAMISLALAGGDAGGRVREGGESEAERLRQLNEEVARIAEVLARLARGDRATGLTDAPRTSLGEPRPAYGGPPPASSSQAEPAPAAPPLTARDVRTIIRARRLRDQYFAGFGEGLFEDPAWDMLLDLYAATLERGQVSVSSLCIAAAVAPTTALRWITRMTEAGMMVREPDPFDRRRVFLSLSSEARAGMDGYFAGLKAGGLPLV